jgi:hypothetical protein
MSSSCAAMMSHPLAQASMMGVPLLWVPASILLGIILLGGVIWLFLHWQLPAKAASPIPFEWQPSFTPDEQGYCSFSSVDVPPERGEQPYTIPATWEEQPQAHYPVLPPNPMS